MITVCGVPKLFNEKFFNEDSIIIDVGISFDKVKAITPTAGGIGIITTTILLSHVVEACETMECKKTPAREGALAYVK